MKKIFIAISIIAMMLCLSLTSSAAYLGDVDGNGKITAADARTILRVSAKLENLSESKIAIADVNGDDKITAADARTVLRMSAKLEAIKESCNHNYSATEIQKQSCEKDGIIEYRCTLCNEKYQDISKAIGHNYSSSIKKAATCGHVGIKEYICKICNKTKQEEIKKTSKHSYVEKVITAPTYDASGKKEFRCTVCNASYTENIEALKIGNPVYIHLPETPQVVNSYNKSDSLRSSFNVEKLTCTVSKNFYSNDYTVTIAVSGERLDTDGSYYGCEIGFKLYDKDGYVVESEAIVTDSMSNGEKVKEESRKLYNIEPGEYYLKFYDYHY